MIEHGKRRHEEGTHRPCRGNPSDRVAIGGAGASGKRAVRHASGHVLERQSEAARLGLRRESADANCLVLAPFLRTEGVDSRTDLVVSGSTYWRAGLHVVR